MKSEMITSNVRKLTADAGKVLTNGEIQAKVIYLGIEADASAWTEEDEPIVVDAEYEEVTEDE